MASRSVQSQVCFRFGEDFELDLCAYELRRRGISLKLKPIPMELLIFLVERRGELTTREQIVERIWGKRMSSWIRTTALTALSARFAMCCATMPSNLASSSPFPAKGIDLSHRLWRI